MPDQLLSRLGARVRDLRARKGLTQQEVADKSGLHITYIARVEAGKRNSSIRSLADLSKGLGVSLSELMEGLSA